MRILSRVCGLCRGLGNQQAAAGVNCAGTNTACSQPPQFAECYPPKASLAEDRHGKWEELCFGVDSGWTAGQVLDNDASGSLNFKEFKAACRSLGEQMDACWSRRWGGWG